MSNKRHGRLHSRMMAVIRAALFFTTTILFATIIDAGAITEEQLDLFQRDGYLYVPNFFSSSVKEKALLVNLIQAGDAFLRKNPAPSGRNRTFSTSEPGLIFGVKNGLCSVETNGECENLLSKMQEIVQGFRDVALRSSLVETCAELMQLDPSTQNMRVLRDVFLSKPIQDEIVCDWHVDDQAFWPEAFTSALDQPGGESSYRSSGINVWIAMDDMPREYGGSMAVAPGSHKAAWRYDAYRAIGQNRSTDINPSKEEMFELFAGGPPKNNSCNMPQSDPELRKTIEATKVVFDIRKGDVLFADRLLFHRTMEMTDEGRNVFGKVSKNALQRYSIRYVPGSARLPSGFNVEASILTNPKNEGRTLNEVAGNADNGGAVWYPQVWPTLEENIEEGLNYMGRTLYSQGRALQAHVMAEIFGKAMRESPEAAETTDDATAM